MSDVRIAALNVYPVKGCRGIQLAHADARIEGLSADGVRDREWMIVDRHGRFVTQREQPRLALVETSALDSRVTLAAPGCGWLELPDNASEPSRDVVVWRSHVRGFDAGDEAARWISAYLGGTFRMVRFDRSHVRPCNPEYAGDGGAHTMFADGYPVLVIGQGSLDDLNERLRTKGTAALPMNRFRPNVVLEGLAPYDEDHLDTVESDGVTLRLVKPCIRCKVTTTDQVTAKVGVEPLSTLSTYRRNDALAGVMFGMNAIVTAGVGRTLAVGSAASVRFNF